MSLKNPTLMKGLFCLAIFTSVLQQAIGQATPPTAPPADAPAKPAPAPPIAPSVPPPVGGASKEAVQNPQGINTQNDWHIDFGYLNDLHGGGKSNAVYYQILYKGNRLIGAGKPIVPTNVVGTSSAQNPDPPSDTNDLVVRLERSSVAFSGGILDSIFTKPLPLGGSFFKELRGVLQASAPTTFKQFNFAGGLETRNLSEINPFHWLNKATQKDRFAPSKTNIENWLFIGAEAENRTRTASGGGNQDDGLITYRSFAGRGFQPVVTTSQIAALDDASQKGLKALRDQTENANGALDAGKFTAFAKSVLAKKASAQLTGEEILFYAFVDRTLEKQEPTPLDRASGLTPPEFTEANIPKFIALYPTDGSKQFDYDHDLQALFHASFRPIRIQPSWAVWIESSGWYSLFAPSTGSRFNNLFSANLQLFLNPKSDNPTWLKLRFESGKERAAPTVDIKSLVLSAGFTF